MLWKNGEKFVFPLMPIIVSHRDQISPLAFISSNCAGVTHFLNCRAWICFISSLIFSNTKRCRCRRPFPSNKGDTINTLKLVPHPPEMSSTSTYVHCRRSVSTFSKSAFFFLIPKQKPKQSERTKKFLEVRVETTNLSA